MFCFDFQPFGGFDLFVTGRRHFFLSERSLSFNHVMITLTSARPSARTVELASGVVINRPLDLFAPLAVVVQAGCSAFPFYTPTIPLM